MSPFRLSFLACIAAIALGGCSTASKLLGGDEQPAPQMANIPVGNQLALPPDLALAQPSNTVEGYQPNGQAPQIANAAPARAATSVYGETGAPAPKPGTLDYNLAKYGISKYKPDGTLKTSAELNAELRKAILAEKRRANPNYGTIRNIGAIFSDG